MTDKQEQKEPRKSASKNPWYILANIYQATNDVLIAPTKEKNRRIWNRWMFGKVEKHERERILDPKFVKQYAHFFPEDHFDELSADENRLIEKRFSAVKIELPDLRNGIDFINTHFLRSLKFHAHFFPRLVTFRYSLFENTIDLGSCIFFNGLNFQSCIANGHVNFRASLCENSGLFHDSTFQKEVDFENVCFNGDAKFNNAKFLRAISFCRTHFKSCVFFDSVEFQENANFQHACFEKYSSFRDSQFIKGANFRKTKFNNSLPIFIGSEFNSDTYFSADDEFWPNSPVLDEEHGPWDEREALEQTRDVMAIIRRVVSRQETPEQTHYFFRKEMEALLQLAGRTRRFNYELFKRLSNFGDSILRPLCWLILLIFIGTFSHWLWTGCVTIYRCDFGSLKAAFFESFSWSTSNALPFFNIEGQYLDRPQIDRPVFLQLFGMFQKLGGVILLFLIGLGLRNRFRIR